MPQRLRLAQATEHLRQAGHDRLQGLYQHRAFVDRNDVLAAGGTETDFEFLRLHVPAHGHASATAVAKFRATQWRSPLFGLDTGDLGQLLGEHALLQGELFAVRQMLHAATTATTRVWARRRATQFAGL